MTLKRVPRTMTGRMSLIGVSRAGRSETRRRSSSGCGCFRSSCVIGTGRNGAAADEACCPRMGIGERTAAIRAKAAEYLVVCTDFLSTAFRPMGKAGIAVLVGQGT